MNQRAVGPWLGVCAVFVIAALATLPIARADSWYPSEVTPYQYATSVYGCGEAEIFAAIYWNPYNGFTWDWASFTQWPTCTISLTDPAGGSYTCTGNAEWWTSVDTSGQGGPSSSPPNFTVSGSASAYYTGTCSDGYGDWFYFAGTDTVTVSLQISE